VCGHRHEAAQRCFVRHIDDHAVPEPVHHERPEATPYRQHAQRLVDGCVVYEKYHRVHTVQLFQLSEEMEHTCNKYTPTVAVYYFIIILL